MGDTALRGLYHVLASSLLVIIRFVKNDLPDREINLVQPLSTKGLAKRSSFFHAELRRAQGPATFKQFRQRAAKRERCHAPHASNGEQARRILPSIRLPAPKVCSWTAALAPVYVKSTGGRLGRQDEERWC